MGDTHPEEDFQLESEQLQPDEDKITIFMLKYINLLKVLIFIQTNCLLCLEVMDKFTNIGINYFMFDLDKNPEVGAIFRKILKYKTGKNSVPLTFVSGYELGNHGDTIDAFQTGRIYDMLEGNNQKFDFDLIIIGGSSGSISAAKEAVKLGRSVALFNFVQPTSHGYCWSVGGMSLNMEIVPKKLFHHAAHLGDVYKGSESFGWRKLNSLDLAEFHEWKTFVTNVQAHLKRLNLEHLKVFLKENIFYQNRYPIFIDKHTIKAYDNKYNVATFTAQNFIIATGVELHIPNIPGSDYAITAEDIFYLEERPHKVLIIGDSFIASETAGLLHGLGVDVTIISNSDVFVSDLFGSKIKTFDDDVVIKIKEHMKYIGIKFLNKYSVQEISQTGDPELKLKVTMLQIADKTDPKQISPVCEFYSAVLFATECKGKVKEFKLDQVGVTLNEENFKIIADENGRSTCRTIYAVCDTVDGQPELTACAIKSGIRLIKCLYCPTYGKHIIENEMLLSTTIFTPLEYSFVGYSEKEAVDKFGKENISCFDSHIQPVEWKIMNENKKFNSYAKMICNKREKMKIIGLHFMGPNASEIMQGFSLAVKLGATKYDFDKLVGIHPTSAEAFTNMSPKTDSISLDNFKQEKQSC